MSQRSGMMLSLALGLCACGGESAGDAASARAAITDLDWELTSIDGRPAPLGAGQRRVTLRLDAAATRGGGFAGCNRYSAPYRLNGDSLSFGPAISTKMACSDGMELERRYLVAMPVITTFRRTDSTLTLSGPSGPLAQFTLAAP
jgi:heat shock protein HslJ